MEILSEGLVFLKAPMPHGMYGCYSLYPVPRSFSVQMDRERLKIGVYAVIFLVSLD